MNKSSIALCGRCPYAETILGRNVLVCEKTGRQHSKDDSCDVGPDDGIRSGSLNKKRVESVDSGVTWNKVSLEDSVKPSDA